MEGLDTKWWKVIWLRERRELLAEFIQQLEAKGKIESPEMEKLENSYGLHCVAMHEAYVEWEAEKFSQLTEKLEAEPHGVDREGLKSLGIAEGILNVWEKVRAEMMT